MNHSERRRDHHQRPGLFWPILLIVGGILFLLGNLQLIPSTGWDLLWRLWPLILIAAGLDGLLRRDGFVGSIMVIGLGTIFLLANLDWLRVSPWTVIVKFWPIFIIAWGLDLIIGKRTTLSAVVGVLVGLALIGGIIWLSGFGTAVGQAGPLVPVSQRLDDIKEVSISIKPVGGVLDLKGGANTSNILEGNVQHSSTETLEQNYSASDGKGILSLRSRGSTIYNPFWGQSNQANWAFKINNTLPLDLETEVVMGEQQLDLTGINLKQINSQVVLGESKVILAPAGIFQGTIKGVIGGITIRIPKDAVYQFKIDSALTTVSYPSEFSRQGDMISLKNPPAASSPAGVSTLNVEQVIGFIHIVYLP